MKAIEIELKAHAADKMAVFRALEARFTSCETVNYVKEDRYFFPVNKAAVDASVADYGVRVRRQIAGSATKTLVTCKTKARKNGLETNVETEFAVDNADALLTMLGLLGLKEGFSKKKQGRLWRKDELTAELCEVSGGTGCNKNLGWFCEVEILADDESQAPAARDRLVALLAACGIDEAALEPRYYTELLA
jgi:predicted adenylyl cyclase CyaB